MQYKDRILRHYDSTVQFDSNGTGNFHSFSGSFSETQSGLRIKYIEANGNLYFTTSAGIQCISALNSSQFTTAANYIRPAGGIQALDVSGVVDYSTGGWFIYPTSSPGQSRVAYRVTWGFNDANNNFVEGAPSSKLVLTNFSTTDSSTVDLTFQIPSAVLTESAHFFYRIYRTAVVQTSIGVTLATLDPGDEENLVIQDFPTTTQLAAKSVTVLDNVPESLRAKGPLLYTNEFSGEGILQSNYPPPIAKDINLFQSTVFYANTQTIQSLNLTLLSVQNLISGTSTITVAGQTYTLVGTKEIQKLQFLSQAATTSGGYFLINSASDTRKYFVWYNKDGVPEVQNLQFDAQAAMVTGGYFIVYSANDLTKYIVWFDKDGTTSPPAGADTFNGIFVRVPIITGVVSADDVVNAIIQAAGGNADFALSNLGAGLLQITNLNNGVTTAALAGLMAPGPGFTATVITAGTDPTPQPDGADTVGRLAIPVDIKPATSAADVAQATATALNTVADFNASGLATFTVTAANAFIGDVYQNNNQVFTVLADITGGTTLSTTNTGIPLTSGTLTKVKGFGDDTITYSAFAFTPTDTIYVVNTDNGQCDAAVDSAVVPTPLASAVVTVQLGAGEDATKLFVLLGGSLSPAVNIDETARSLVKIINSNASSTVDAFYQSAANSLPGLILLQAKSLSAGVFSVTANNIAKATAGALVSGGDTITIPNHSFVDDDRVIYSSTGTDIGGLTTGATYYIINSTDNTFQLSLTMGGSAIPLTSQGTGTIKFVDITNLSVGAEFSPALPPTGTTISSANLVELNAIYYSKFQQPEAVPIVNKFLVGPKDRAILRIIPLRTGLMIIKEDGIYRLTGVNGQFQIDPFDNSAICLAADSAQVLNNQIYMFSTQGVVTLTDTGVSVISRPIEDQLNRITTPSFDFKPNTFGVSYESDRAYLLWTVTNTNDTQPTQCFRYNTFTNAWTRWPIVKTCGLVLFSSQVLYLGPGDENFIEVERKNINRTDYADRVYPLQLGANSVVNTDTITLSSVSNVEIGDVLVQTQFLTIAQYNQLLKMLDYDPQVGYKNYFSTLGVLPGGDLRAAVDNLAAKLDTDPGLSESDFASSIGGGPTFADFQSDYNIITALLNANGNVLFHNYPTSSGTLLFEMIIIGKIQNTNNVVVQYTSPVIQGGILLYRGIKADVIWAPQIFGDPSISKHVSEGTFMFEDTSFFSAHISYASDLMPSFEEVPFPELGIGDWGGFSWNAQSWGGAGTSAPIRTYIPRNKQYCRFIRPRFTHNNAREKFSLLGGSLTFRPLTERAYRS